MWVRRWDIQWVSQAQALLGSVSCPPRTAGGRDAQEADTQNGILDKKRTEKKGGQKQSWLYEHQRDVQFSDLKGHKKGKKALRDLLHLAMRSWNETAVDKDNSVSRKNCSGVRGISEWRTICAEGRLQEKMIKTHCKWNRSPDSGTGESNQHGCEWNGSPDSGTGESNQHEQAKDNSPTSHWDLIILSALSL